MNISSYDLRRLASAIVHGMAYIIKKYWDLLTKPTPIERNLYLHREERNISLQ